MAFLQKIKEQILIDTARHCCICHRYKGVKVEVHHIKQKADGGEDTYENAIVLCFDCHCDAGHYNANHPRGTKFSPSELKKAKANWIQRVKDNNITNVNRPDDFLCRYYVCKSFNMLRDIVNGDMDRLPIDKPLMISNDILHTLKQLIEEHPTEYRHASAWGESYGYDYDDEEYLQKFPETIITDKNEGKYSYYKYVRVPNLEELSNKSEDIIVKKMLEQNIPLSEICYIGVYDDGCGGGGLSETYLFREIWFSFIEMKNISNKPIKLKSIISEISSNNGFVNFNTVNIEKHENYLPQMAIEPNQSVLFPMTIILPPLHSLNSTEISSEYISPMGDGVDVLEHKKFEPTSSDIYLTYGNRYIPNSLKYYDNPSILTQKFHTFDINNMFILDTHIMCGSCPHLFFISDKLYYERELLAHCQGKVGEDFFTVPKGVDHIIIAEIEDEVTDIDFITINGTVFREDITLNKSDSIKIPVQKGDTIKLKGKYTPNGKVSDPIVAAKLRNDLVNGFLNNYK